ncbi:hypothetical protein BC937DRAFT_94723 [Endogone sp. FLAS-F59071]|nr:hypothetical protein BC937DRAFT_94723 [Endogone sp. FLAS-F59071]|eukprot:RUS22950.1 hypothetical protein BC937DRAFT_94723 [Endogone sp. FLAS-F59071]
MPEFRKKVLKWKQDFKASVPISLLHCSFTNYLAGTAGNGKGPVLVGEHEPALVGSTPQGSIVESRTAKEVSEMPLSIVLQYRNFLKVIEVVVEKFDPSARRTSRKRQNVYNSDESEASETEPVTSECSDDDDSEYHEDVTRPPTNECGTSTRSLIEEIKDWYKDKIIGALFTP